MEALFNSGIGMVVYLVFFSFMMWFILLRPQKKREKALLDMQESIKVGDMVMTNAGMYGKVVDVINNLFVIEFGLNKGIRIPIQKSAIAGIKEPNLTITKDDDDKVEEVVEEVVEEEGK